MKKKILLIDDDKNMVKMLKIRLESEGFNVLSAYDGEEGIEKTLKEKPNLIILDIMLPKMDGYQVCHKLKEDKKTWDIPVLMLTAKDDLESRFIGLFSGAIEYMSKPYESKTLLRNIKQMLSMKEK